MGTDCPLQRIGLAEKNEFEQAGRVVFDYIEYRMSQDVKQIQEANATGVGAHELQLVSIVVPVYNEAALLEKHVDEIVGYTRSLRDKYDFEIILVNDGSRDDSGRIIDELARQHDVVQAAHHPRNFGLGQALRYGFALSHGDYVIVLDVDLSYSTDHVAMLLERMASTRAKIVLASPYADGGRLTNVPPLRKFFSVWGNRFLRIFARGNFSTLTCMVRAYDGPFIRTLILRSTGMDLMPEVIYKTMILRGRIDEVPAHLDWSKQITVGPSRTSSMRLLAHVLSTVFSGFFFRPFLFLILPGVLALLFATYVNAWMFIHFFEELARVAPQHGGPSEAFALAYAKFPHTFLVAFLSLMLAVQLLGLGILAVQAQKYFEELFFVGVSVRRLMDGGKWTDSSTSDRPGRH